MNTPPAHFSRRQVLAGAGATALGIGVAGLTGCSPRASSSASPAALPDRLRSGAEVVVAMDPSVIKTPFDPVLGFGETGVALVNSPLTVADENNAIAPHLATAWTTSPDGLTWTFELRSDATFHDGSRLTAEDVAFTYNEAKSAAKVPLPGFDKAVATGPTTVELHLSQPMSTLLYATATLGIVPRDSYGPSFADKPMGSGPYRVVDYIQGQQLVLARHDGYFGGKPFFAKVTILLMEADAGFAAAKSGQVDMCCVYPALSHQRLAGFDLVSLPTFGYRAISLPTQPVDAFDAGGQSVGNAVTCDPALRRALARAINRQQMIQDCLLGYGETATDLFDAFDWGVKAEAAGVRDGDVDGADVLLDQAGWARGRDGIRSKNGTRAAFTLLTPSNDTGRQAIAESFVQQAKPLGVDVQIVTTDFGSMLERNRRDAVVLGGGRLNPYQEFTMLHSSMGRSRGWSNIACYANPDVDRHLEQALRATDPAQAQASWHRALWDGRTGGSMLGDAPYLSVGYIRHNYFIRRGLDIGRQRVHPHDHFLQVLYNVASWRVAS